MGVRVDKEGSRNDLPDIGSAQAPVQFPMRGFSAYRFRGVWYIVGGHRVTDPMTCAALDAEHERNVKVLEQRRTEGV